MERRRILQEYSLSGKEANAECRLMFREEGGRKNLDKHQKRVQEEDRSNDKEDGGEGKDDATTDRGAVTRIYMQHSRYPSRLLRPVINGALRDGMAR